MLCHQKELLEILELSDQVDQINLVMPFLPKYAVSLVMGFLKRKMFFYDRSKDMKDWERDIMAASMG